VETLITQPGSNVEIIGARLGRSRFDLVIAAGGDGTVAEVMAAGHRAGVPIAIVPRGTANIVARELRLPTGWRHALRHALSPRPRTRKIDLARVNSGYSALASGIGFDAMVMRSTPRPLKYWLGRAAYILAGAWWLPRVPLFDCRIVADGEEITTEAVVVIVANAGMLVGGPFRFAPGIALDDGWLDLCVYQPRSAAERLRVIWSLLTQRMDGAMLLHKKVRSVEITAPDVMWHEVDGDVYQGNALKVDVVAGGVEVLV
jgi:diacylglycerol kinase (ATP)